MLFSRIWIRLVALFGKEPNGQWKEVSKYARISKRDEACFVMINDFAYLIGGRGLKNIDVYDPTRNRWHQKTGPPIELHHMQCVAVPGDNQIYIVSAWTGLYPMEQNVELIYIYNILNDTWTTRNGLPEERRRGGAASVLVGRKIYVSHGNRGGHETANFSTSYGWLDYYDIDTDTWITNLPDAPNPRDHTGGGYIRGRYICVAGGRDGGSINFFNAVVLPTDCYDLMTNTWSIEADIPQGRGGSAYGTSCDGKHLIVAGGEGFNQTWRNVDLFDGKSWTRWDDLIVGRHGTGLAVDCNSTKACEHKIHIASGAATEGGNMEIRSVETYYPNKTTVSCSN